MSQIVQKIKEVVKEHTHSNDNVVDTTNAAQPRGVSNVDHHSALDANAGYSTSDNYGTASSKTAGPHKSDMMNRLDPRVDSDLDGSRTYGSSNAPTGQKVPEGTHGPHDSAFANRMDPRVDSDVDRTTGINPTGPVGAMDSNMPVTDTMANTSANTYGTTGARDDPYGPHSSKLVNKLDPTVNRDAARDAPNTSFVDNGPHGSRLINKLDPTVDSSNMGQFGQQNAGMVGTGMYDSSTTAGHPNVAASGMMPGTGPAPHTAGPHRSDILNKMDPRVDSDLDGSGNSNTKFGNQSYRA